MDSSAQNMSRSADLKMCPLLACSSYTKMHTHNHRQLSDTMSNTFKGKGRDRQSRVTQWAVHAHQLCNSLTLAGIVTTERRSL